MIRDLSEFHIIDILLTARLFEPLIPAFIVPSFTIYDTTSFGYIKDMIINFPPVLLSWLVHSAV